MLEILKASAGSGKTFNLAKTYIGMLFRSEDRYAYRHILAVTFTNKATDEMKSRILKELDILARDPESSGYYKDFSREFGGKEKLQKKAAHMLVSILHDYNAFSVSTIDKFFQMTLKSFAREIGQVATYQVDLDKASLVKESVDRILDSLSEENRGMLDWLRRYAMDQIQEEGSYKLEKSLYEMAGDLESDNLKNALEGLGMDIATLYSKENLSAVRKACRSYREAFTEKVVEAANRIIRVFSECGCSTADTTRGFMNVVDTKYAVLTKRDEVPPLSQSFVKNSTDSEKWFPKKNIRMKSMLEGVLEEPLGDFVKLMTEGLRSYNTAGIILRQLYSLGIASQLHKEYEALLKEKNVLCLDDSNTILRTIIGEDDAPFIYEKLGVRYENFLLDEFQDTSRVQWENFRPLLKESLSHAGNGPDEITDLVVGDIKQSIYRWRGSDWNLLASEVKSEFKEAADDTRSLSDNWRSSRNVVEFNNMFFSYAAAVIDRKLGGDTGIPDIYSDVTQTPRASGAGDGSLEFTFCEREETGAKVVDSIRKAVKEGNAEYGDIAVLVRGNKEGAEIASVLTSNGIPVISDDSLGVKSSIAVRRLVSLMSSAGNPGDSLGAFLAGSMNIECPSVWHSLIDLAEELVRRMVAADPGCLEGEKYHLQSFMDVLCDWVASNGNNLSEFLDYWDGVDPKIASPADPKAVRIMTVHKSKGLEFGYVIIPFTDMIELYPSHNQPSSWCAPEVAGTDFPQEAGGVFKVEFSSKAGDTLFSGAFHEEERLQAIDNLNILYVAFTRASRGLHVIGTLPKPTKDKDITALPFGISPSEADSAGYIPEWNYKDMAQILYGYLRINPDAYCRVCDEDGAGTFTKGALFDFEAERRARAEKDKESVEDILTGYPSFPLNPSAENEEEDVRERGRLKFSADSVEFFSEETSSRRRGTVLHAILSEVNVPEDVRRATRVQVDAGAISAEEGEEYAGFLEKMLASPQVRGWFGSGENANEVEIIDIDGSMYRPDRVVIKDGKVLIIDYKFGEEEARYRRQIGKYASLYRAMGYEEVKACLWYVNENKIVSL